MFIGFHGCAKLFPGLSTFFRHGMRDCLHRDRFEEELGHGLLLRVLLGLLAQAFLASESSLDLKSLAFCE